MSPFYILRLAVVTVWFLAGCLVLLLLALIPWLRYEVTYYYGRWLCPVAVRLLGIHMTVRGQERLDAARPCIFIVNHQHLIDGLVVGALLPRRTITVAKQSLRWIPVFGWLYGWCGHLFIDRSANDKAVAVMRRAHRKILARGLSVLLAPEGTRSHGKGLLPFKRGAFHLAVGTGLPLQPIAISSFHKWVDMQRFNAGPVLVDVLEPLPTKGLTRDDVDGLIATAHARMAAAVDALDAELAASVTRRPPAPA